MNLAAVIPSGRAGLHRWIYYLTAGFLFAACVLRSLLLLDGAVLGRTLLLLAAWPAFFLLEPTLSKRWRGWFTLYLVLQCALIVVLLLQSEATDFFGILFAVLAMQTMRRYPTRHAWATLGAFALLMTPPLLAMYSPGEALVLAVIYSATAGLVASYSLATRRAEEASARNRAMGVELEGANRRIQSYSAQVERMAVSRERHRLAHDLHDSVTQTIFSMTLTTQSALLLLDQDPPRVATQLDRLAQLTRGALAEMQLLISELRPDRPPESGSEEQSGDGGAQDRTGGGQVAAGLVAALERYLAERAAPQGLIVTVDAHGDGVLSAAEERNLLRIAQEAVNNVVKHANTSSATVQLSLSEPFRLQVADGGVGFEPARAGTDGGLGLDSMRERAAEIGWALDVISSPEGGTQVVAMKVED
ncbi:MAG: sensor histidine kinase [Thermoleophilia bacterium]